MLHLTACSNRLRSKLWRKPFFILRREKATACAVGYWLKSNSIPVRRMPYSDQSGRGQFPRLHSPRIENPHRAGLTHASGGLSRVISESPEKVSPDRTFYCSSGVLCNDQAVERSHRQRGSCGQKHRCAERCSQRVDRDTAPGR